MPQLPPMHEEDRFIDPIVIQDEEKSEPINVDGVTEQADGSALVDLDGISQVAPTQFDANLAETFPKATLRDLATTYLELVDRDKQSRKKRDEQYEDGLRRTGLGNDAPGGAGFDGASKVVHPMLAESCVDFASRAIKELFPPAGPVKTDIQSAEKEAVVQLATRKAKYLNYQLTTQIQEYRAELEQLLTQLPMGGSQYQKFYFDNRLRRIRTEFVPIDDLILPFSATDFYNAQRATHVQHITDLEYKRRIKSGLYREVNNLGVEPGIPEQTAAAEANDKIEGREPDAYNDDGLRDIYEITAFHQFEEDEIAAGEYAPYILVIDKYSEEVLAIYRNWEEGDALMEKLDWMVEWKFIPWRGAYAIGFPHLIGGLSAASTGALRALLDSAHINNSASLIKLRGGRTSGQNVVVEPTQIAEVEGPAGVDDIRKTVMAMPFNPPSAVLFELLGWLTAAGKGVIATAEDKLEQVGDRTPVGTTQALIEQGSHTYSSIHSRLHYSQAKALRIICRLNKTYMDDQSQIKELGDMIITREDFANSNGIAPVSDPETFSEAQRFAQSQGVIQLRQLYNGQTLPPLPFNDVAIARRMLRRMRIEDIDEILPEPPKPQNLNPIAENVAAVHGTPILALPEQNHLAHIYAHLEFCVNPVFFNPITGSKLLPIMVQHTVEHIAFYYADLMEKQTQFSQLAQDTPTKDLEDMLADKNTDVLKSMAQELEKVMEQLSQVAEMAKQVAPPPPMDPAVEATFKAAMAEIDRKKARDQAEIQLKQAEVGDVEHQRNMIDLQKNQQDNEQKARTELLKNNGDNQTKQWIAALQVNNQQLMNQFQAKLDAQENELNRKHDEKIAEMQARHQAKEKAKGDQK